MNGQVHAGQDAFAAVPAGPARAIPRRSPGPDAAPVTGPQVPAPERMEHDRPTRSNGPRALRMYLAGGTTALWCQRGTSPTTSKSPPLPEFREPEPQRLESGEACLRSRRDGSGRVALPRLGNPLPQRSPRDPGQPAAA